MGSAFVAALWSFLWGISALSDLSSAGDLKTINIVLGILYLIVGLIETLGFFAALRQIIPAVRIYAFLSVLAAVIVVAAEAVRFSTFFTHKSELINTCTTQATGETVETFGGFWGSRGTTDTLTQSEAQDSCNSEWTRSVWSAVAWLIISTLIGWFFAALAWSYYHQALSPQPIAPSQTFQLGSYGNQPQYGPYNPQGGYQYPAPPGPPPRTEDFVPPYDPAKVPDYDEAYTRPVGDQKTAAVSTESVGYSAEPREHV